MQNAALIQSFALVLVVTGWFAPLNSAQAQPAAGPRVLTPEQWRGDLQFLVEKVRTEHRNPWARTTREDFDRAAADLAARIPALSDTQVVVELAALVATLGDGHSRLSLPVAQGEAQRQAHLSTPTPSDAALLFRRYPFEFRLFDDGLFITGATQEYTGLIGQEVVSFGSRLAEDALQAVRRVTNADNEMGHKLIGPHMLGVPEVCRATGLADDPERLRVRLRDASGSERDVVVMPLPREVVPKYVQAHERAGAPTALWIRNREIPQWFEFLPAQRALFVHVNDVRDAPDKTMAQFAAEVQRFIEANPVERVIVDLRWNGGGNNYLNRGLVLALARSPKVNHFGGVFTLIGRNTFSAAMNLASQLELFTNTLFAGEPTGSTPSHYGDARRFTLPASGLTLRLSSIYWRDWNVDEKRPWIAPDLPVALKARAFFEGRDPVLDAVLAFKAPEGLADQLLWCFDHGGTDAAARRLLFTETDPATASLDFFSALRKVGRALLDSGRPADAVRAYQQNQRDRPDSFEALADLGEAQLAAGNTAEAIAALEKALSLRHGDPRVLGLLNNARGR